MAGGLAAVAAMSTVSPHLETWTRDPQAIRDWAATAKAGDELVYARERHLGPHSAGGAVARRLAVGHYVTLVQRAVPGGNGIKEYIARRLKPERASIGRATKPSRPQLDGDMARVLNVLRRLVRERRPCPSNRDLAKLAGVGNADQASYQLKKLVQARRIRVAIVNRATGARVVTLLDSQTQTADPMESNR